MLLQMPLENSVIYIVDIDLKYKPETIVLYSDWVLKFALTAHENLHNPIVIIWGGRRLIMYYTTLGVAYNVMPSNVLLRILQSNI